MNAGSRRVRSSTIRFPVVACATALIIGTHTATAGVNVWTSAGPLGTTGINALAVDPSVPSTTTLRARCFVSRLSQPQLNSSTVTCGRETASRRRSEGSPVTIRSPR
jgi:hypothetical protein